MLLAEWAGELIRASPPKEKGFKIDKKSSSMDIFS
jgi:hypothetical protein